MKTNFLINEISYIGGKMKKTFLLLLLIASMVFAQESRYAVSSKEGIYVKLGSSVNVEYKLERRLVNSNNWEPLFLNPSPKTMEEFLSNIDKYSPMFPSFILPDKTELTNIWLTIKNAGTIDSSYLYGNIPVIALSAGAAYLDQSAQQNVLYQYRITASEQFLTKEVKFPEEYKSPEIKLIDAVYQSSKNIITWKSIEENKPSRFIVYREEILKNIEVPLQVQQGFYQKENEILYNIIDTTITGNALYRYYLIPFDLFENKGKKSEDAFISSVDFNTIYVHSLTAKGNDTLNSIELAWNLNDTTLVKNIEIYRSENYDSAYTLITELSPTVNKFNDENVIPLKMYYYKLAARGNFGEISQFSNRVFALYKTTLKPQPPIFISAEGTPKGIKLKWLKPDVLIKGYYVYRNNGGTQDLLLISPLIQNDDSLIVWEDTSSALTGRNNYTYTLTCENTSHLMSGFSDTLTARPKLPIELMTPLNLSISREENIVYLNWEDMYRIDNMVLGYKLYKKESAAAKFVPIDTLLNIRQNHFQEKIEDGNEYEYAVASLSVNGEESKMSVPVKVILNDIPSAPGSVTLTKDVKSITIIWDESLQDNVNEYNIYRYQRGKEPIKIKTVNVDEDEYKVIDNDVKKGDLYFYYLTVVNQNGKESVPGEEASIRF